MLHRLLLAIFLIAALALGTGANAQITLSKKDTPGNVVTTPRVRAELLAHAPEGIAPGQPLWLGLQITHQKDWHTYWKNPGDSGLPTALAWTLPAGLEAGDIAWPVPHTIRIGSLANYGYEGQVLLSVPVQVTPAFKPPLLGTDTGTGDIEVKLHATWLVCRVECIPEEGDFALKLPVRGSTAMHSAAFAQSQAAQPQLLTGESRASVQGERLHIRVSGLPQAVRGKALELFSEEPAVLVHAAVAGKDWTQQWDGDVWTADVPLSPERGASPAALPLVLTLASPAQVLSGQPTGLPPGWRTVAQVQGRWTAAQRAEVPAALAQALQANQAAAAQLAAAPPAPASPSWGALASAIVGGLLGGLLLNLMPCVFPVLALKVMGFARHGGSRRAQRLSGLAYTAGVVLSFLALGGLLLALRAAGEQLGWGFQLQSPAVVAALAALFTLIGLNLAGVFELGMFVPGRLATLQARHPVGDALLSGVLAVAVASPCTAPFMGASLGLAVSLPAAQALAVFAALGVGMALPYLLLSEIPALARWLPKPGAWMDTLRRALAFPMFATVVWLVWVLGQQSGIDGAGALLALLVALSAVVWSLTLRGRTRAVLAIFSIAALAVLTAGIGQKVLQAAEAPGEGDSAEASTGSSPTSSKAWQPWSAQRVAQANAEGQAVFVDFTAAWCITCQYNKQTTLADAAVQADFAAKNVLLLRADWTRRDPAITAALTALGRSGVPVYLLQAPGRAPVVFTEVLGVQELRAALARL